MHKIPIIITDIQLFVGARVLFAVPVASDHMGFWVRFDLVIRVTRTDAITKSAVLVDGEDARFVLRGMHNPESMQHGTNYALAVLPVKMPVPVHVHNTDTDSANRGIC